jgi:hypothetical protein
VGLVCDPRGLSGVTTARTSAGVLHTLYVIFGYVVEDIGAHILEKVWSILVARSSRTRLGTRTQWLDRTSRRSNGTFVDSAMEMRRGRLGTCCGVVGVSRGHFIV